MKYLYTCLAMTLVLFISGCGPVYETNYSYQPPRSTTGKMCINQCMQAKTSCNQICKLQKENCRSSNKIDAMSRYENYRSEQLRKNKPVKKTVDDFDDTLLSCDIFSSPCSCDEDYNACYQNCGGTVQETKVCTAFCDKK